MFVVYDGDEQKSVHSFICIYTNPEDKRVVVITWICWKDGWKKKEHIIMILGFGFDDD